MKNSCKNDRKESQIPSKGVIFLGGHTNMIKKLKQIYPKWEYITDDQMRRKTSFSQNIIFYWTGHGSHTIMKYVYSRMADNTKVLYVTATNISMLLNEMNDVYSTAAVG